MGKRGGGKKKNPLSEITEDTKKLQNKSNFLKKKKIVVTLSLIVAAFFMVIAVITWGLPVITPNYGITEILWTIGIIIALFLGGVIPLALKIIDMDSDFKQ
ncbi:hypothetical protein [Bacillus sp. dmp10]|uniref:hypothetical protein n=1 Tax=Bacillus sp. dmp10 TaxID=2293321 RepID=UPI000E2F89DB|nr:hypothetical protein DZB83_02620 [Bacillus sp. dmp10]